MRHPGDVELRAVVEGRLDALRHELVEDDPIVNATDRREAPAMVSAPRREEAPALAANCGQADRPHADELLRGHEIGTGFLGWGIDVEEDHLGGVGTADDRAPQKLDELRAIDPRPVGGEIAIETRKLGERFGPDVALHHLHRVEGGEALALDEARLDLAIRATHEREVDGERVRLAVGAGDTEGFRDASRARRDHLGLAHLLQDLDRGAMAAVAERRREEDRRLGEPKGLRRADEGRGKVRRVEPLRHRLPHALVDAIGIRSVVEAPELGIHP